MQYTVVNETVRKNKDGTTSCFIHCPVPACDGRFACSFKGYRRYYKAKTLNPTNTTPLWHFSSVRNHLSSNHNYRHSRTDDELLESADDDVSDSHNTVEQRDDSVLQPYNNAVSDSHDTVEDERRDDNVLQPSNDSVNGSRNNFENVEVAPAPLNVDVNDKFVTKQKKRITVTKRKTRSCKLE